ncbi:GNAT family N-acetyltransferase [Streptomyces sp. NPDC056188]|uniref:GNAT family N-acetyltransferase n=1 Tax=Streptomyces sp. NPDC056188 TaxID=3345740 RepID=UPI0035D9DC2B
MPSAAVRAETCPGPTPDTHRCSPAPPTRAPPPHRTRHPPAPGFGRSTAPSTEQLVGMVTIEPDSARGGTEVWYTFLPEWWGRGLGREAVAAAVEWARDPTLSGCRWRVLSAFWKSGWSGPLFQEERTMAQVSRATISAEQFSRVCDEVRSTAAPEKDAQSIRDCALRIVQTLGLALSTDDLSRLLTELMAPRVATPPGSPRYTREAILDTPDEQPGENEGPVR